MNRREWLARSLAGAGALLLGNAARAAKTERPNVLLIIVDDLNSWVGCLGALPGAKTPNTDRLAARGTLFANAHCAAPVCNPSRTALLTGLRPSTTGIYDNAQAPSPPDHLAKRVVLLPQHFKNNGYVVLGAGKVPGHSTGRCAWDESFDLPDRASPPKEQLPLNNSGKIDWGPFPDTREQMSDWQLAGWASDELGKRRDAPFFLAVGIVKPHLPWYVPKEYFDRISSGDVALPPLAPDDIKDIPAAARRDETRGSKALLAKRAEACTAYLAACAFADDCVGRVLDALESGPNRDDTVVVLCGDNGFQMGEKNIWGKGQLWEESTHVPLMIVTPGGGEGRRCARPVSLLDLYPTLVEMCGLPEAPGLEGACLAPLLSDPDAQWDHAAVSTTGFRNHAVRTERWRYIRYADDSEELYDHDADPREWTNLASQPQYASTIADLRRWLPAHDAPRNPDVDKAKKET
ncbi:MAG: sulfatase [Candidatus Sumerlaeota bacterium]|nr:sulfatase [Candidatus Sumerlaeota bacterium]